MGGALDGFENAVVHCQAWSKGVSCENFSVEDIPRALADPQGFVWLELRQPSPQVLAHLQSLLGLHELAIEDVHLAEQRPKLEIYSHAAEERDETLFMVVKPLVSASAPASLELGELHVFLEERVIVLLHLGHYCSSFAAMQRFVRAPARLGRGHVNALHAVLDEVVDDYLPWRDMLETRLDQLEQQVISNKAHEEATITELYAIKRDLLQLRAATLPLEDIARSLSKGVYARMVAKVMRPYFRDVHDHIVQLLADIDFLREAQLSVMSLHLALGANRQGVVLRKLGGWAAILAVPTMVFSMYGMNFDNMPELHWEFGYPLVIVLTLLGGLGLHRWLKRSGWL